MSWPEVDFESLFATPSRNGVYKSKDHHGSGVPIVNMGELFAFNRIGNQPMSLIRMSDAEMDKSGLMDGDLLFGRRSLVEEGAGKCSMVYKPAGPLTFESSIIRVRLNRAIADPEFFFNYFRSPIGRSRIRAIVGGAAVKGIRGSDLKLIKVHVPPIDEQIAIRQVVALYDDLITTNQRRIALLEDAARRLNQSQPAVSTALRRLRDRIEAAEALFAHLTVDGQTGHECIGYPERLKQSWLWDELYQVRNIRPSFRWGLWGGIAYSAIDTFLLKGRAPWTLHHHADHTQLRKASECAPIVYPKPDGKISFDRLSSVFISATNHAEEQPCHLRLKDASVPISTNLALYNAPETRYCPAGVYEIVEDPSGPRMQINAQNCLHCKTCDIKDPTQNIDWAVPEGGGGPNYPNM